MTTTMTKTMIEKDALMTIVQVAMTPIPDLGHLTTGLATNGKATILASTHIIEKGHDLEAMTGTDIAMIEETFGMIGMTITTGKDIIETTIKDTETMMTEKIGAVTTGASTPTREKLMTRTEEKTTGRITIRRMIGTLKRIDIPKTTDIRKMRDIPRKTDT